MIDIATLVRITLVNTRPSLPEISNDTSFQDDLRCDAIDLVCIEMAICDQCGIDLPASAIENCQTVGDLAALVGRLQMGQPA